MQRVRLTDTDDSRSEVDVSPLQSEALVWPQSGAQGNGHDASLPAGLRGGDDPARLRRGERLDASGRSILTGFVRDTGLSLTRYSPSTPRSPRAQLKTVETTMRTIPACAWRPRWRTGAKRSPMSLVPMSFRGLSAKAATDQVYTFRFRS
jgi:hypothetical protein